MSSRLWILLCRYYRTHRLNGTVRSCWINLLNLQIHASPLCHVNIPTYKRRKWNEWSANEQIKNFLSCASSKLLNTYYNDQCRYYNTNVWFTNRRLLYEIWWSSCIKRILQNLGWTKIKPSFNLFYVLSVLCIILGSLGE